MKKKINKLFVISGITVMIVFFAACSKTNDNGNTVPVSGLMAFNLAPDMKGIGITLSGNVLPGAPLFYTNYTGGYLGAYPGTRSITAYDYFVTRPISSSQASLEPGKYYSLFVVGANNNYSNLVTKDNIDSLTVNGQAYIRYVNAIPDSSKPKVTINAGGKDVINEQAAFTNASDFVPVNAGNVTININNGGNIQAGRIISVEASKIYTVLLTGLPDAKDSAQSVQIKYIENGTVSGSTARKTVSSSSVSISK